MNDAKSAEFACERCGKRFRWTRSLAMGGRPVRCPCGNVMRVPAERPEHAQVHAEEHLHHDHASSAAAQHSHHPVPASAHGQYPAPYRPVPTHVAHSASATATAMAPLGFHPSVNRSDRFDPEAVKNFYMPWYLLAGGILAEIIAQTWVNDHKELFWALRYIGYHIVVAPAVLVAAVLIAAKIRHIKLGPPWQVVLKISALSIASMAVLSLLNPFLVMYGGLGPGIGLVIEFVLFFALLRVFFNLDQRDAWYCLSVMIVIAIGMHFVGLTLGIR